MGKIIMGLKKILLEENKKISIEKFKKTSDEIASRMGYHNGKYSEEWIISTMESTFIMLFENEKYGYNRELLLKYIPVLKELFPYNGIAYRALTIDIPSFNSLYSVIKNKFSEKEKNYFRTLINYSNGEIKKNDMVEKSFKNAVKLYLENTRSLIQGEFDSWSKSKNGIKYFKGYQHGNHNVIISANILNGLDLLSMADFINEYRGKNVLSDYYKHTKRVEEVISPIPDNISVEKSRVLKKKKTQPKETGYNFI